MATFVSWDAVQKQGRTVGTGAKQEEIDSPLPAKTPIAADDYVELRSRRYVWKVVAINGETATVDDEHGEVISVPTADMSLVQKGGR